MSEDQPGKIILLNGATSSGKSSISRVLQAEIDEPFWHFSIDHLRDAGVLPLDRIRRGEFSWAGLRDPFFEGFHRALPAFVGAGNNMIVEHVVETPAWMARLVRLLDGLDVFFVGVHCPLAELERRELARGDRPVGGAQKDFETVHRHAIYDLELDGSLAPSANARTLISAWRQRPRPSAFARMAADPGWNDTTEG